MIEDHLKRHIGLKPPWGDEGFGAYIQLLLDEINDKTAWDLRMQPWKHYSSWNTRLRVRKELSQESDLVRRVQLFALEHGKAIDQDRVKAKIAELLVD